MLGGGGGRGGGSNNAIFTVVSASLNGDIKERETERGDVVLEASTVRD